ncbi:hypothetical protein Bca52824_066082 [Brassica carinata]|uniref:Replication protein A 70 kDa DNA-binding subunit B/D first OB fold domain-containing protein n=1 Tax=Brassica carinata TaxID=52824 RepID=A0A8X7QLA3_BRACI|nr:hypothetical protein Bca52824_066082 [Brassica carinata]
MKRLGGRSYVCGSNIVAGGLTIEMVLIDSNGVEINASIKKDLVNQFDSFLSQGYSKILINFSLNDSLIHGPFLLRYVGFKTYNSPFVLKLVCVFS